MKNSILTGALICMVTAAWSYPLQAKETEVKITPAMEYTIVTQGNDQVKVERIQDTEHLLDGAFAETSRPCPPYCINPLILSEDVHTVDELEVIKFMETSHTSGSGMIVDTRSPGWHERGTIPGSVNIPFAVFEKPVEDTQLADVLERLGAKQRHDVSTLVRLLERIGLFNGDKKTDRWDYSQARDVLLWCNGPWCGQTPRAIKALLSHGYPADKLYYYRGGIQTWQSLGLATVKPVKDSAVASR